ncbi:hypothetical protein EYS00_08880 [Alteromonas sp. KUL49]|nr:hypothetical protein EYS00_08880 [Alteromonas sp. KUL49]
MSKHVICLLVGCFYLSLSSALANAYTPNTDEILIFVGQDNKSVGGHGVWRDGYIDHVGMPAGITHYVYFSEGKTNDFGYSFDIGSVDGLNRQTRWGAGPMCLRCYLEAPGFENTLVHLSISMELDEEGRVANGDYDHLIKELADFIQEYRQHTFYLRIGYEFDGSWNHYEPEAFKGAWRRIVDHLRREDISNFATVLGASRFYLERSVWDAYWPGDEYVDWLGYSYWHNETRSPVVFELAREKNLPVFAAEVTPRGFWMDMVDGNLIWVDWFSLFFDHIEANKDVVKAISFINADWDADPMWKGRGWGDSRIQRNVQLKNRWLEKMAEPIYIHTPPNGKD